MPLKYFEEFDKKKKIFFVFIDNISIKNNLFFLILLLISLFYFIFFRIAALDAHDREVLALATAKNNLESFIYDMRDKLEHDPNYKQVTTSNEQTQINEKLTEMDAWLWDDGINADVEVNMKFKKKKEVFIRFNLVFSFKKQK